MVKKWLIAIPVVLLLSLGGCAGRELPDPISTPAVVEGTWVATGPEGENVTLELRPDGSMSFTNLPVQIVHGGPPWDIEWTDLVGRDGTWAVQTTDGNSPYMYFAFAPLVGDDGAMLLGLDDDESGWFITYPLVYDSGFRLDFKKVWPSTPPPG